MIKESQENCLTALQGGCVRFQEVYREGGREKGRKGGWEGVREGVREGRKERVRAEEKDIAIKKVHTLMEDRETERDI